MRTSDGQAIHPVFIVGQTVKSRSRAAGFWRDGTTPPRGPGSAGGLRHVVCRPFPLYRRAMGKQL